MERDVRVDAEEERQQLQAQLGVPVLPERVGVARLLWRIWVERGRPLGRHKKVLRALGDELHLSPQLFAEWVGAATKPHVEKIQAVADKTGSDLAEWLYEFGLLRTPPRRSDLSPADQYLVRLLERYSEKNKLQIADSIAQLLRLRPEDAPRDTSPTDETGPAAPQVPPN